MKNLIVMLSLFCAVSGITARAESSVGNGAQLIALEGFRNYLDESKALREAITESLELLKSLGLDTRKDFPQLAYLTEEIQYARYILVPEDVEVRPNRSPGDYPIGGYLVAATETRRGAPTKIYPRLITQLSQSQLVQMVIHEALHRALPDPMNSYESAVEKITSILTQYSPATVATNLKQYLTFVSNKKLPWLVTIERRCPSDNCYAYEQDEKAQIQKVLQPVLDDGTLSETLMSSRIEIKIRTQYRDGAFGSRKLVTFAVEITDKYRQAAYSFSPTRDELGDEDEAAKKATQFIRDTINKIQQDLQW